MTDLAQFYDDAYSHSGAEGEKWARWRALSARGKADHVVTLRPASPAVVCEVGCGDGALLAQLAGRGYGDLKTATAEAVVEWLTPVRERYEELRGDEAALEDILGAGAEKARAMARETLAEVRAAMGVGPPSTVRGGR